ncbi:MAG TPA: hypothetical protein VM754_00175 [Actinomycetota bacterium]|nr:hypothetical protein [Actinomycetota bacterium]
MTDRHWHRVAGWTDDDTPNVTIGMRVFEPVEPFAALGTEESVTPWYHSDPDWRELNRIRLAAEDLISRGQALTNRRFGKRKGRRAIKEAQLTAAACMVEMQKIQGRGRRDDEVDQAPKRAD